MKGKERAYQTILVIVLGFSIISWHFEIKELFYFALGINLIALLFSSIALLIDRFWYGLAEFMGKYVSKVILSLVYFFVLVPIAAISKSKTKKDLMIDKTNDTTFTTINKKYSKEDLKNLW